MCILYGILKKENLKKEWLENGYAMNRDGGGIAFIHDGKIVIEKSKDMDDKAVWDIIQKYEAPFVVHFRRATAGGITDENAHPFFIGEKLVVAHNGVAMGQSSVDAILGMFPSLGKKGTISDTHLLARACHHLGVSDITRAALFFSFFFGKWVLMNDSGKMVFLGDFEKPKNGIYISNSNYKASPFYTEKKYYIEFESDTNFSEIQEYIKSKRKRRAL